MNQDLTNVFNPNFSQSQIFDQIKITIASPEKMLSWSFGEIKNLKQLIIERLNRREMVYFVHEFLVR